MSPQSPSANFQSLQHNERNHVKAQCTCSRQNFTLSWKWHLNSHIKSLLMSRPKLVYSEFRLHKNYMYCHMTHLPQQCHNSKCVIFQEEFLNVLKCYNFVWVQRRHNCSPAASFANCVMTLYLLKSASAKRLFLYPDWCFPWFSPVLRQMPE